MCLKGVLDMKQPLASEFYPSKLVGEVAVNKFSSLQNMYFCKYSHLSRAFVVQHPQSVKVAFSYEKPFLEEDVSIRFRDPCPAACILAL